MWPFKPKPKPKSKVRQHWDNVKYAFGLLTGGVAILSTFIAYIQIDTAPFQTTTKIVSATGNGHLYTRVKSQVEIPELTYVVVSINGHQLAHNVYPEGLPRGEILIDRVLPFNVANDRILNVSVDITFNGPRTLFIPERLTTQIKVKQEKINENSNSNYIISPSGHAGIWL